VQGRLRDNVENIGRQYDPASTDTNYNMSISSVSTTNTVSSKEDGKVKTTTSTESTIDSTTSGSETIGGF
jgi:hypothetical protein